MFVCMSFNHHCIALYEQNSIVKKERNKLKQTEWYLLITVISFHDFHTVWLWMAQRAHYRQIIRDNSVNRVTAVMGLLQCSGRPASVPNSHRRLLLSICWHVYKYKLRQRFRMLMWLQLLPVFGVCGTGWSSLAGIYRDRERETVLLWEKWKDMMVVWVKLHFPHKTSNRGRWFIFSWERWEYVEKYINTHLHTHLHVVASGFIQIDLQMKNITNNS